MLFLLSVFTFAQIHSFTNAKDLLELVSRPLRPNKNLENHLRVFSTENAEISKKIEYFLRHESLSKTFAL